MPDTPDLVTVVRSLLDWTRRVGLIFAGLCALLGVMLGFAIGEWWRWPAAGAALVLAGWLGYFAVTLSRRSPLVRAVTTGPEKITRVRLQPAGVVHGTPDQVASVARTLDWQVLIQLNGKPLPGHYVLRRSLERAFLAGLLARDPDLLIEAVTADGSVYRVEKSGFAP